MLGYRGRPRVLYLLIQSAAAGAPIAIGFAKWVVGVICNAATEFDGSSVPREIDRKYSRRSTEIDTQSSMGKGTHDEDLEEGSIPSFV